MLAYCREGYFVIKCHYARLREVLGCLATASMLNVIGELTRYCHRDLTRSLLCIGSWVLRPQVGDVVIRRHG